MQSKKQNQRGSALVAVLAVLGIVVVLGGIVAMLFIGAHNTANSFEQRIKAQHDNNKNILSQYSQKVMEAAQVPSMMRDDIVKVATAAMQGRYGAEGSKAVFQMIREQNPSLDPSVYVKLQTIIESGRTEFQTAQTVLLDTKRAYETALGSIPKGTFISIVGYPKLNLAEYGIVTTDRVEQSFKAGKETAPLQLRPLAP